MLPPFGKIHPVGHRDVRDIFDGPVRIEEKVDGSQFSFGVVDGALHCRSKGVPLDLDAPGMFSAGVAHVKSVQERLPEGYVFRAEYLAKPRHNVLTYNNVPDGHLVLWGVEYDGELLNCGPAVAERLEVSLVPLLFYGVTDKNSLTHFLDRESFLGGPKIEGVVVKRGSLAAKFVSADFKEMHTGRKPNPKHEDIRVKIAEAVCTEARYAKTRQHLRDEGKLTDSPQDIPALMKELHLDIEGECLDEIKECLLAWALPMIKKTAAAGLPAWYKNRLNFENLTDGKE